MLIILLFQGSFIISRGMSPRKNARKVTTIFFNRCYNIEKLTPSTPKKSFSRRKKGKKVGKKIG